MNIFIREVNKTPYEAINVINRIADANKNVFAWQWEGECIDYDLACDKMKQVVQALLPDQYVAIVEITGAEAAKDYGMTVIPPRLTQRLAIAIGV